MAREIPSIRTSAAFHSAKRAKANWPKTKWEKFKNDVETGDAEEDYKRHLLCIFKAIDEEEHPSEEVGQALSGKKRIRAREIVKEENVAQRKVREVVNPKNVVQGGNKCTKMITLNVTENHSKYVGQAQSSKKDRLHSTRKLRKVVKGAILIKIEDDDDDDVFLIEDEHLFQKTGRSNNLAKVEDKRSNRKGLLGNFSAEKNQLYCREQVQVRPRQNVVMRENVVQEKYERSNRIVFSGNNWAKKNFLDHDTQAAQAGSKDGFGKNKGVQRKNVVKKEGESSSQKGISGNSRKCGLKGGFGKNEEEDESWKRGALAQVSSKGVFGKLKCVQRKNVVTKEGESSSRRGISGNNCAKKNQLDHKAGSKRCYKKLKGIMADKNREKEAHDESDSDVEIIELDPIIKESHDESDSDLEILDSDAIIKGGYVGPFLPSTRNYMDYDELQLFCPSSSLNSEFRNLLFDALRKPFDKEEYKRHSEALKAGSYRTKYPDLDQKLTKHRYDKGKRITILRGLFFWLQYCPLEKSFKPWEDEECLSVDPYSY